jgi:hypothetical protein
MRGWAAFCGTCIYERARRTCRYFVNIVINITVCWNFELSAAAVSGKLLFVRLSEGDIKGECNGRSCFITSPGRDARRANPALVRVNRIRCAQCGLQLKYSPASSAVASRQPPPPMKEPPQMRYSPGRFLLTAEMSGELRVTMMASRSLLICGTKPLSKGWMQCSRCSLILLDCG